MTVSDVFNLLNERFDFSYTMHEDNVGLLVGSGDSVVKGIHLCLDLTDESLADAIKNGANLIVTHHPVIFDGLKRVTDDSRIYKAIRNDIAIISAHTNLDAAEGGINHLLTKLLGLVNVVKPEGTGIFFIVGRVGELPEPMSADELAKKISYVLNAHVTYVGENKAIKTLAICSGGGGGLYKEALLTKADAYLTGDCKYDYFMHAHDIGHTLFDAGHFHTEDIIIPVVANLLKEAFPDTPITETHFCPIKHINI